MDSLLYGFENMMYGGIIDEKVDNETNKSCASFLDRRLMVLDTGIASAIMLTALVFALKSYSAPFTNPIANKRSRKLLSGRILLAVLCLTFGIELGYKICSKQLLYLLYPCHVMTAVQVSTEATDE